MAPLVTYAAAARKATAPSEYVGFPRLISSIMANVLFAIPVSSFAFVLEGSLGRVGSFAPSSILSFCISRNAANAPFLNLVFGDPFFSAAVSDSAPLAYHPRSDGRRLRGGLVFLPFG